MIDSLIQHRIAVMAMVDLWLWVFGLTAGYVALRIVLLRMSDGVREQLAARGQDFLRTVPHGSPAYDRMTRRLDKALDGHSLWIYAVLWFPVMLLHPAPRPSNEHLTTAQRQDDRLCRMLFLISLAADAPLPGLIFFLEVFLTFAVMLALSPLRRSIRRLLHLPPRAHAEFGIAQRLQRLA